MANPRAEHDGDPVRLSTAELKEWLRRRVQSREPAAVVRFGDGELALLEADATDAESMRTAQAQLQRQAGGTPSSEEVLDVKTALEHAFEKADVLGVLFNAEPVPGHPLGEKHMAIKKRIDAMFEERLTADRAATTPVVDSHINYQVIAGLPSLLAGRRVSVISCRDIGNVIEEQWGLSDVAVYRIPSECSMRDLDGAYEAEMHDVPIWPDGHHRVRSELTIRERGEVFLVGAGVFGKDLCIHIRERGGIGLDVGSALDHIVGKPTRSPMRRMLALSAEGAAISDIASDLRARLGVQIDHDWIRNFLESAPRARVDRAIRNNGKPSR